jgi:hypothetical protein
MFNNTERLKDRTEIQKDRKIERQNRNTERQKDWKTEQKDRETEKPRDRKTERQKDRKAEKHNDRKTQRQKQTSASGSKQKVSIEIRPSHYYQFYRQKTPPSNSIKFSIEI